MTEAPEPSVRHVPNGWDLVTAGTWEISIGPDGLIHLPRHLVPDEVDDFVTAVTIAAEYGAKKRAANEALAAAMGQQPPSVVVDGGGKPVTSRMPITGGPAVATIGRPAQYISGAQPAGTQALPAGPRVPMQED